ncbi:MAG TPA: site-specific tyrosine recombinase/integron integrase [Dehalococcoidia bacterium]|nr:site-specific tyrosine recombinase/integron integrase [Dehalococcoidia bacterium]
MDPAAETGRLLARYLEHLEATRGLSAYTLRNYATDLRHLFAWLAEHETAPLAITRLTFRSYLAHMQAAGTAPASVTRRVSTAKSFYKWLRLQGLMKDDPLAAVRGPKQPRRLPHVMTLDVVTALIAAADGDRPHELRDRALLELMYAAGVRVSEAHGLDVQHVDMEQQTVLVHGKGGKQRLVVFGDPARDALARYLRDGRPALLRKARGTRPAPPAPGQPLFVDRGGTRLSQRAIQILVRKYALKAGIDERVHPHLFRHTFATHLLDGGAELRVVQELLGHASPNTTQIYLHVTEERQRKVIESSLEELARVEQARRELARRR